MFRIRRVYDDVLPINREALRQAKEILKSHFGAVSPAALERIGDELRNPFKHRFRTILYVAEDGRHAVKGFALVMHDPQEHFCYLDFMAAARGMTGRGVGGALYERVRQDAKTLGAGGIFFECLPDDPADCPNEEMLGQNIARLAFYERYGARPIIKNKYHMRMKPTNICMPYLVYDGLDSPVPLTRRLVRRVVRSILERKYGDVATPEYVGKVVNSFRDDPARLRDFRYLKGPVPGRAAKANGALDRIGLVVNDRHAIHHVRERGYVESPVRIESVLAEITPSGLFERIQPRDFPERRITAVHDRGFVEYLKRACTLVPEGSSIYPYVFPTRNTARPPKDLSMRAGYYCIDTFTPLNRNAYVAAKRAVDCALTAAASIVEGRHLAYALVRPPGHHAERKVFGGFCYFNNAAIAAEYLCAYGKVAVLDIDYHHGNGTQDVFYERADVLTISIHGHPNIAYPHFTGFEDETGAGPGDGYNLNLPLPERQDGGQYRRALAMALARVECFNPLFLVVCLGLDTAKGDPTGTWTLGAKDFEANGRMIGEKGYTTLVVQEGGYRTRTLGTNALHFFRGLVEGSGAR